MICKIDLQEDLQNWSTKWFAGLIYKLIYIVLHDIVNIYDINDILDIVDILDINDIINIVYINNIIDIVHLFNMFNLLLYVIEKI